MMAMFRPAHAASGPALQHYWQATACENFLAPQFNYSDEGVATGVDGVMTKVRENINMARTSSNLSWPLVACFRRRQPCARAGPEEMKAIVDTAHGLGRKVAAQRTVRSESKRSPRRSRLHRARQLYQ
jgi:hypothetical protein